MQNKVTGLILKQCVAAAVVGLVIVSQGCSSSSSETATSTTTNTTQSKHLGDFVNALRAESLTGEKSEKAFAMVGATDGFAYGNDDFKIEVYEFPEGAEVAAFLPYKNGNFGMQIHRPTEGDTNLQLVKVFESFN